LPNLSPGVLATADRLEVTLPNQAVNYQSVLTDLRARRDRLNYAIAAVEQIIGEVESKEQSENSTASSNVYRKMTIGDAAVHFIRSKGKPQRIGAIIRGLRVGGINSKSKNLYTTTYNTLTERAKRENSDVVKVGPEWALSEWQRERVAQP